MVLAQRNSDRNSENEAERIHLVLMDVTVSKVGWCEQMYERFVWLLICDNDGVYNLSVILWGR